MEKNKISIIFTIIILLSFYNLKSQNIIEQKALIKKSFSIFCDTILLKEKVLQKSKFSFSGFSSFKHSSIIDIAICNGDITYSESWNIKEAELVNMHSVKKRNIKEKVKLPKNRIPSAGWFRYRFLKGYFAMEIKLPVEYDNFYFVEIFLLSKAPAEVIITLKFNKELKFQHYCLQYIDLD